MDAKAPPSPEIILVFVVFVVVENDDGDDVGSKKLLPPKIVTVSTKNYDISSFKRHQSWMAMNEGDLNVSLHGQRLS